MKQLWQKIVLKIDALSLRERAIIFAAAIVILVTLFNTALLDPQFEKQKQLSQKVKQTQAQVAALQAEIQQKLKVRAVDPDVGNRTRLEQLKQQSNRMQTELLDMQKGLVSPDKMPQLLDDILKRNGKLTLLSLKTLPASNLNSAVTVDAKDAGKAGAIATRSATPGAPGIDAVYKHGFEIVLQGGYLDMLNYMAELEALPWRIFWGKAKLSVEEYPKATLTLTLFTLSLDQKWLNL